MGRYAVKVREQREYGYAIRTFIVHASNTEAARESVESVIDHARCWVVAVNQAD